MVGTRLSGGHCETVKHWAIGTVKLWAIVKRLSTGHCDGYAPLNLIIIVLE